MLTLVACISFSAPSLHADAVTDWNAALGVAQKASGQSGGNQSRFGAIMHAAVFDAVNGIARGYTPYLVSGDTAPPGADAEAAGVQAAYRACVTLYPAQTAVFEAQLVSSLALLTATPEAITAGRAWGESVAQEYLLWRSTDGFRNSFSYLGTTQPGCWRTPSAGLSGVNVQFGTIRPFTLSSPTQFRPAPPYGSLDRLTALASAAYAADLNEVQAIGSAISVARTAAQTDIARFWHATDNADLNAALRTIVPATYRLVDTARLFALCNMASCDATITVYDTKYAYNFWRPIDAIRLADTDNNPATESDPTWNSVIATPRHPEYPSAHSIISGALLGTAALILGDEQTFTLSTPGWPSITRNFTKLSDASVEVGDSRVWIGFHFREACDVGLETGYEIAHHAVKHFLRAGYRGQSGDHLPWHGGH